MRGKWSRIMLTLREIQPLVSPCWRHFSRPPENRKSRIEESERQRHLFNDGNRENMHDFRDKNCGLRDGKSDQCWFKEEGFGRVGGNGYAKLAFFLPILKRMAKHCCVVLMLIYFSQATFIITRLYSPLFHSLSRAPVSLTYLQLYDQWLLTPSFPFVAKRWHALGLLALIFIWLKRIFRVHLVVDMWRYFIRGCFRVHRYGRL